MKNYELLTWDTEVLGIRVAKILPAQLNTKKLSEVLNALKKQGIELVYWATDSTDAETQKAAKAQGGFLADEKITYLINLDRSKKIDLTEENIEEYPQIKPTAELEFLALESGLYSRFNRDKKFGKENFEKIYKLWIYNSTMHNVAHSVLVIKRDQKIAGMVTLGEKNNRGDIGLLAVHPNYRGLHFGTILVKAAQAWCVKHGYSEGQVVTQKANQPACKLYEKCSYHIEKIENFYHFWLS